MEDENETTDAKRYKLVDGQLVEHPEGQWVHVFDALGIREWDLDEATPTPEES